MASRRRGKQAQTKGGRVAETYRHDDATSPLRPDVVKSLRDATT